LRPALDTSINAGMAAQRVAGHPRRMRASGYRPIQIRVPDVCSPGVAAEAHRQSILLATANRSRDDQDFVDATAIGVNEEK
jgi:Protein  of unknown function (DUF3018)